MGQVCKQVVKKTTSSPDDVRFRDKSAILPGTSGNDLRWRGCLEEMTDISKRPQRGPPIGAGAVSWNLMAGLRVESWLPAQTPNPSREQTTSSGLAVPARSTGVLIPR